MGPIALFDKSFLQSLSIDEALWFDHFFIPNICPMFYVETLADLEKTTRAGRTPENEVAIIARRTPEFSGAPCVHHSTLCIGELLGHRLPLNGQIPVAGGRPVKVEGKSGVVIEHTPEAKAFLRWQQGKFLELERDFASDWRASLNSLDLSEIANRFKKLGVTGKNCRSLAEAKAIADGVVKGRDKPFDTIGLALTFLNIPRDYHQQIIHRWSIDGYPALVEYAPYTSHVLTVEIFFQIALAASLISSERVSNRNDIAYLFYLPFCMVFTSSDRLHERCVALFLRQDQDFAWGQDLKTGLQKINEHYLALPEDVRDGGIMSFAHHPPGNDANLVVHLWDRHMTGWRDDHQQNLITKPFKNTELAKSMNKMSEAPTLTTEEMDFDPRDPDSLAIQRTVSHRRGSWWQLPKDIQELNSGGESKNEG